MSHRISGTSESTLQRGKACLSCRRRKMRCDGQRPYCTKCVRGNREDDCEYTDNQGRTRSQMLEEHVALLQARIHELENPRVASQSILLRDPYASTRSHSTGQNTMGQSMLKSESSWWELEEPPVAMVEMLLGIFMPHSATLGFSLSMEHFLSDVRLPNSHQNRPHPALLHSVFLWALHLSRSEDLMQHENLYLQRTLLALQDALRQEPGLEGWLTARRRLHAIQAEVLLSQYFFSLGRLLEGQYHTNAAISLAISCGLHQSRLQSDSTEHLSVGRNVLEMIPARTPLEFGERIRVFWTVFILDRCWSAVLGVPCVLTDEPAPRTQIDSDWPMEMVDYERMQDSSSLHSQPSGRTIQRFLSGELPRPPREGSLPLATSRVMAAAVFERSAKLSDLWHSQYPEGPSRSSLRTEIQTIARITTGFARSLTPVDQLLTSQSSGREDLLFAHGLAHATMTTLHSVRSSEAPSEDISAINSALVHASEILKILEGLSTDGSIFVDPVLSMIGFCAAEAFIKEEDRVRRLMEGGEASTSITNRSISLRASITRITNALQRCAEASNTNAIFSLQADKILEISQFSVSDSGQ